MERDFRILTICSVSVGAVSHGVTRHTVQTSPLWIAIVLSTRRSAWTKWAALPCFFVWLLLMTAIWLFLLGWAWIVSGNFSSTEIAMTVIVGFASGVGIVRALGMKRGASGWWATATVLLVAMLQMAAIRLSLLRAIAHR